MADNTPINAAATTPEIIAGLLLQSQAVTLNVRQPYRYASGIWSPVYCDNRLLLSFPERRRIVVDAFVDRVRALTPAPQLVAGVATAGIAWAAWIAERCGLPLVYIRGAAKDHGKGNRIEGVAAAGADAVVIEDLLSTGGSSAAAVEALRAADVKPVACVAVFSYELPSCRETFRRIGCPAVSLTNFATVMKTAAQMRILPAADLEAARGWNRDPHAWGEARGLQ